MRWQWHQLDHIQIICTLLQTGNHANTQGCSLGLDVSVSRRSRDLVSKRLGLVEMWEGLGLDLVSDWKSNVSASSRSRTIGCRLQAKMHRFLLHCKIAPISFWMQCVYIVCWFTSLLIYCTASAYQDATLYGCMPRPRRHCVRWELSGTQQPTPNFQPVSILEKRSPSQLLQSTCDITSDTFLAWQHQIWPKSQKRHSGAERCMSLPAFSFRLKVFSDWQTVVTQDWRQIKKQS